MPCSKPPAGPEHPAGTVPGCSARWVDGEGSHELADFGAEWHGLGTGCLRFALPVARTGRKTRFPLLARLYGAGLVTRRVPTKGFRDASYIAFSFPRLRLAQPPRRQQPGGEGRSVRWRSATGL